ncbi:hypothetical protein Esi_0024_0036 [Ectocarpus siliculosus]|uniref:Uncharacterized protein n=1 Tax=Ectocarpus siliculosus TaxID=2880 RepID=D8LJ39_ECTSI|nr:hypothetical protein Esi_0024_0036 [Ectocarpus siliculosus]|eukprot:CBN76923.1 hypothetical protein Esi_0024_0036 [Ectocarpus siliculosus]
MFELRIVVHHLAALNMIKFKLNVQQDVTEADNLLPEAVFNVAKRDDAVKRVRLKTPGPPLARRGHQPETPPLQPGAWVMYMPGHPNVPRLAVAKSSATRGAPRQTGQCRALVRPSATKGSEWKVFNDTSETTVNNTDVGKEEAYVLAYRRMEGGDVPVFNEPVWAYPACGTGVIITGSEEALKCRCRPPCSTVRRSPSFDDRG